jgi:hypothetical protein
VRQLSDVPTLDPNNNPGYCGNTINAGSVPAALTDCSFICPGDQYEYCGAGNRLEMYMRSPTTVSSTSSSVLASSSSYSSLSQPIIPNASGSVLSSGSSMSSPLSSSSDSSITPFTTSTYGPSINTATTTTSQSTFITATSSGASTPTGYSYMGCFSDTTTGHALPLLLSNNSITPQLCESLVSSLALKPTPTIYEFYYVEYHKECYAGSSFSFGSSSVTSLYGAHACTDVCSGSIGAASTGTAMCGGAGQFNLYATKSSLPFVVATTQSK